MASGIDALAERVGIAAAYVDALGVPRATPVETKQILLKAMGFAAEDETAATTTLAQLEEEVWAQPLPPCVVLYAGTEATVPVVIPPNTTDVGWRVQLEDGTERSGTAEISKLATLAEARRGTGEVWRRCLLPLPADLPWGYHRLSLAADGPACSLIVTPGRCWMPDGAEAGGRLWGIAAQVYLLRSGRNWGMGDLTDLRRLVEIARTQGAAAVGVNPLHGMFPDRPEQCSPYSPLSRYLLNALNIDPEAIPEFAGCAEAQDLVNTPEFQERLRAARATAEVDYPAVAALKLPVLQAVHHCFESTATPDRQEAFASFLRGCDPLLRESCLFEAIRAHLSAEDPAMEWWGHWPPELRSAAAPGVEAFAREHAELLQYQLWLQWVADEQLAAVRAASGDMAIGVYRDLAVGANPGGAEVWSNPGVMVATAEVGAPPDVWNTAGQNWVLPPFHPLAMKRDGYRSFIALLRANMRHAGGVRIDHAMALERLYWIPQGKSPRDGGYVHYPTEDLIGVIALESHRNRCLVVGEDLGTVAPGFRERMTAARILSYRVLLLERIGRGFTPLELYPHVALSTASSHDLPTLRGWWEETDLDLREQVGFTPPEGRAAMRRERQEDRETLVNLLRGEGLLDNLRWPGTAEFTDAAHRFLARTAAVLMMAQVEDIVEQAEQVNLPASMLDQYPSWSKKLAVDLEALATDLRLKRLVGIVTEEGR